MNSFKPTHINSYDISKANEVGSSHLVGGPDDVKRSVVIQKHIPATSDPQFKSRQVDPDQKFLAEKRLNSDNVQQQVKNVRGSHDVYAKNSEDSVDLIEANENMHQTEEK